MKKIFSFVIPCIVLGLFVFVMNSGVFLKKPFGDSDDVVKYIEIIEDNVESNEGDEAKTNMNLLKKAWIIVERRIQYSVEKYKLDEFKNSIYELDSKIISKDKHEIVSKIYMSKYFWNQLN